MFSSEPFLKLIEMVLVVTAVVADLMLCTRWFREALKKQFTLRNSGILILVFGGISIYGSYSQIDVHGAMINIRDLGPMVAGLIGGPFVGLGAGLIGGIHRFYLGGFTAIPCALATVLAGIIGGFIYRVKKGRLVNVNEGLLFAILMESFHMLLVLLLARPYSEAVIVVEKVYIPMIIANTLGLVIFVLIFSHGVNELKKAERFDRHIALFHSKEKMN